MVSAWQTCAVESGSLPWTTLIHREGTKMSIMKMQNDVLYHALCVVEAITTMFQAMHGAPFD